MANTFDNEIKTMQRLIGFGLNEDKTNSDNLSGVVEYHAKAADGKTYGIIREGKHFYLKVAPKKDTQIIAEDYDYIGGFNNRKFNRYDSYTKASKQFDLKMKQINEQYGSKNAVSQFAETPAAEWQINETKEMRAEIERMNQIADNADRILMNEAVEMTDAHTLPEAPAKNPSKQKVNSPYTDTAVAKGDKDFKETESNPSKAGAPFTEDGSADSNFMQSDKKRGENGGDSTYSEKPKYVETGVAGKKVSGAKAVKMNENHDVKLTEQQVLAWSRTKDFQDKAKSTSIGKSDPYTESPEIDDNNISVAVMEAIKKHLKEDVVDVDDVAGMPEEDEDNDYELELDNDKPEVDDFAGDFDINDDFDDEVGVPKGNVADVNRRADDMQRKSEDDYRKLISGDDDDDLYGDDFYVDDDFAYESRNRGRRHVFESDEAENDDEYTLDIDSDENDEYDEWVNGLADDFEPESDLDTYADDENDYDVHESRSRRRSGRRIFESESEFGKHPAYRKSPMTTPPNTDVNNYGRDWHSKSVKGSAPFGSSKGNSAPYTEEVVNKIADMVMDRLLGGKKKA